MKINDCDNAMQLQWWWRWCPCWWWRRLWWRWPSWMDALVASQIQSLIIKFSCYSDPVQCSGVHHLCTFEEGFPKTKTSSETEKTLNFSISRSLIQESCMTLLQSNIERTGPKSLCLFSCSWVHWIFLKLLIPGDFWVQFYWPIGQCQNRLTLFFWWGFP